MSFQVTQAGESRGNSTVHLKHIVDRECGSHILRLTCALWVYNCTSVPLALQESAMDDTPRQDGEVRGESSILCRAIPPSSSRSARHSHNSI